MKNTDVPAAPDPNALAAQQLNLNKQAGAAQQNLNMVDQFTPWGNLTYSQTGKNPDGTPKYAATQTLSPQQQQLFDLGGQTSVNLANLGVNQSQRISELLSKNYQADPARSEKLVEMQKQFLDPQWNEQSEALRTQLINSGVRPGTEAYDREMRNFSTNRQRAYDQMYLDAYDTAERSALTERNQPLNEISALLSGSQVQQPNFTNTPTAGVAPTDLVGATQMGLNQGNMQAGINSKWNTGLMDGAFRLGGSALGGWMMSDRRVKDDVKKIGKLDNGLPVYSFKYKDGGLMQLGLMAQDVEKVIPEAVAETDSGYKAVNYTAVAEAA